MIPNDCQGTVSTHTFAAPSLGLAGSPLRYRLYTPPTGKNAGGRYPVLYFLHGANGHEHSIDPFYDILDTLISGGSIPPLIVVSPVTGNSYWTDSNAFGHVESAVIHDLIPHIDAALPTHADRHGRALAGFSMGGSGALRFALFHPHLFSGAILLSPAVWDGLPPPASRAVTGGAFGNPFDAALWHAKNYPAGIAHPRAEDEQLAFFIACGDADYNFCAEEGASPDAWQYNMEMGCVTLYQRLSRRQACVASPSTRCAAALRIYAGGHDLGVWGPGFAEGLLYLHSHGFAAFTR